MGNQTLSQGLERSYMQTAMMEAVQMMQHKWRSLSWMLGCRRQAVSTVGQGIGLEEKKFTK